MDFLANENFPLASVRRLRISGHDVLAVAEVMGGAKDIDVLRRASEEGRIVLTFDRDYGELVFHRRCPPPKGIVYFRYEPITPLEPAEHLMLLLVLDEFHVVGMFTVLERQRVRQRPLPR